MTVPSVNAFSQYTGTGTRTFFEFDFELFNTMSVLVTVDGRYVSYVQQETGVVITPAPALGAQVVIYRVTDIDQLLDFEPFESFDAAKTEWACDKLIYLKQEALVYRAFCNLYGVPYLEYYDIENDKGTDARIVIWNETDDFVPINSMGVFAGLVTTNMPNAGTVVEKPDHFAYFQYGGAVPEDLEIYTTPPYPIEVFEGAEFSIDLAGGGLRNIEGDEADLAATFLAGEVKDILISGGPWDDAVDLAATFLAGEVKDILLSGGPWDDAVDFSATFLGAAVEDKLVLARAPAEGIELGIALSESDCLMTPV